MARRGQAEVMTWFQNEIWRRAFRLGEENQVKGVLEACEKRLRKLGVDVSDLKYEVDTAVDAAMRPVRRRSDLTGP